MSELVDDERKQLARAFDRAWNRYYRASRTGAISESVARPALAKHLVALAKQGVEVQHWGHLRIEGAPAHFRREWRVRVTLKASKAV
jgi:hypothetical protein